MLYLFLDFEKIQLTQSLKDDFAKYATFYRSALPNKSGLKVSSFEPSEKAMSLHCSMMNAETVEVFMRFPVDVHYEDWKTMFPMTKM